MLEKNRVDEEDTEVKLVFLREGYVFRGFVPLLEE